MSPATAFPIQPSVWFLFSITMLLLAALSWSGDSGTWKADLLAAAIPAIWHSVGVAVRARSRLLRRVDEPAHLQVLGQIEEALIAQGDTKGGDRVGRRVVNEIWWSAAGSLQGAAAIAEELEELVGRRECHSALPAPAEQPIGTVVGECQGLTGDLWDRFSWVVEAHRLYGTDIEKILAAPQVSDLNHPETRAFVTDLVEAQDAPAGPCCRGRDRCRSCHRRSGPGVLLEQGGAVRRSRPPVRVRRQRADVIAGSG